MIRSLPFDKEKGYSIIRKDSVEIFVYKMEKLNQLEHELRDFLELDDFCIRHNNNSEEKSYVLTYKCVKENIRLKQAYVDFYYKDNPRMKHFYKEEEIRAFRDKWQKKVMEIDGM